MIQQNRLSPVKRSSMCGSPVKSPLKGSKHTKIMSQLDPYGLKATLEKKSPKKKNKENGSISNEDLMNSIHQLSQTFEQREPLSPSKVKLHNNTNSQYSSNVSEMTFSPSKHKSKVSSNKSSVSPSKFEKFVKIDPNTISNPFVTKRADSKKENIKNSRFY